VSHERWEILDREARKAGLLKDVKSTVEYKLSDPQELTIEYWWEEVKTKN
jgi:hypothetical protein